MNRKMWLLVAPIVFWGASCKKNNNPVTPTEPPTIAVAPVTLFEGDATTTFPFKVTLSRATDKPVSFSVATRPGTADAPNDYITKTETLTIPANSTEAVFNVTVVGDTIKELDEQFEVVLFDITNATLANGVALGTIRNDDTFVFIAPEGYTTPENYAGYERLWNDEFNGTAIDTSIWGYDIGGSGWGNNELQFYTNRGDNAFVSGGNLFIIAKKEVYSGRDYTSARLLTKNKRDMLFGRVDIRARLPKGKGIWPALWMLGNKIDQTGWPNCGEMDIMELRGSQPNKVAATIHYGPRGATQSTQQGASYTLASGDFSQKFHVFSLIWEANTIEMLVDDVRIFRTTSVQVGNIYPFNEAFFFIFNIAVGGNYDGSPDASTVFPQQMLVDYIRVFRKL